VTPAQRIPRLGFLGVGWIGRNRLEAVAKSGLAEIVGVSDPNAENASAARELAGCSTCASLEELLDANIDGVVIATPSALHAEQSITALERGVAVFCQKPLGRTENETVRVVAAARRANGLLGVDLSYRFVRGVGQMRDVVASGELGTVYAADLVFHNAYGPDKPWFYEPALSGGGCVIDLGSHLVDLAQWVLEGQEVVGVSSTLFARGERLNLPTNMVEDYATAQLDFSGGASVRLACSWNLPAGCDAVIEAAFYGTDGGVVLRNVSGSFYDFTVDRHRGTSRENLSSPPDDWGGRAALDWVTRLAAGEGFDSRAEQFTQLAAVLDRVYGRGGRSDPMADSDIAPSRAREFAASWSTP
jgi:predicted dehydrogenase